MIAQEVHGLLAVVAVLTLIFLRVPIGIALLVVGFAGNAAYLGHAPALAQLQLTLWETGTNFLLIALPLFILMGQLAAVSNLGADLHRGFQLWLGRTRGGLAMTSVMSSASFGAITGSSVAALMGMANMLLPQMLARRYDASLAAGSVASGSVLAILIPPSLPLVFYSAWTETSLGDLFVAAVVPGLILTGLYLLTIFLRCFFSPELAPPGAAVPWREKLRAVRFLAPTFLILGVVLASIYLGIATPTEAAAIGVSGVLVAGVITKRLSWRSLEAALSQSASLSANIFLLLLGGLFFSRFLGQTGLTAQLVTGMTGTFSTPEIVILMLVLMYLILGAVLDTFGMIILTLPFTFPVVTAVGYDPVWFGVFLVVMCEVALVTPPVGMHAFLLNRLQPGIDILTIYRGCVPFVGATLLLVVLLVIFPELAVWLPEQMR